jgi:hypothetical protein
MRVGPFLFLVWPSAWIRTRASPRVGIRSEARTQKTEGVLLGGRGDAYGSREAESRSGSFEQNFCLMAF